jgi:hypothetical protein
MCVVAGAVGAVAGGIGSLANSFGGGGGVPSGAQAVYNPQSLGQDLTGILSGGLSAGLGISGLAGGNLNQLQAGAAAANPFGSQSNKYYGPLQNLLGGGLQNQIAGTQAGEQSVLNSITGNQYIGSNTGLLSQMGNISTPGVTASLQNQVNNPTQLLSSVNQGNSQISNVLGQNPYSFTQGEQFQYNQGMGAVNASLAAQGMVGSGNQMISLENYGQNFASQATQQNLNNLFTANSQAQGLQGIVNQMGTNQFNETAGLGNYLTGQQQQSFGNQLSTQQLYTGQQQDTAQNLMNLLSGQVGIGSQGLQAFEGLIPGLLTATQASQSSPGTAGGILANLGVANQASAGNLASGIGGLANGIGNMLSGVNLGGGGISTMGSENPGASSTSTPDDLISGYTG